MAWPRPDQQAAKEERCEGEDTDGIRCRSRRTARTQIHVERKMKGLKVRVPDILLVTLAYMLGTQMELRVGVCTGLPALDAADSDGVQGHPG